MKLLICDDDISTIDVIQNQIDCQEFGIQRILRTYNGEAAKEVITAERPELVLCDIEMPKCSGIDVLKFVHNSGIQTEFAFITNFESFEFAREAIRYGATNYITKPLDISELKSVLVTMISEVKMKRAAAADAEDPTVTDMHLNDVFRRIRDGALGTDQGKIDRLLRRNRAGFTSESLWRLVCIVGDTTDALYDGWSQDSLSFSFGRLTEEVLADYIGNAYTLTDTGERLTYVTCFLPAEKLTDIELTQKCRQLIHLCTLHYSINPVCLIGDAVPFYKTAELIPVMRAKIRKLRFQVGSIYMFNERFEIKNDLPRIDEERVIRLIRERRRSEFTDLVASHVDKIIHTRVEDERMVVQLHQDLLQAFYTCLKDNSISVRVLFEEEALFRLDQNAERSVPDIMSFAGGFFDKTVEIIQGQAIYGDIIAIAKAYIQQHFRENISRDQIAAVAFITPNYLSKRFSSEMGMNIREYVNQLRIEEAKRLLLTTDDSISEIASMVGYDNISYFSTVFKKLCGASPADWRMMGGE